MTLCEPGQSDPSAGKKSYAEASKQTGSEKIQNKNKEVFRKTLTGMNGLRQLLKSAINNVSAEYWMKVVSKYKKFMEEDWKRDVQFDNIFYKQEFLINLQEFSSYAETDSDMDLACTYLREYMFSY
ncbi:unnamed protein product [Leptidea sinapis]|uniref:Uncharacterized protein n=1 Tax=Leptidea sinapis TaxID=189913 RepID=A0A5E4PW06_9NEOP|nr:unnamed protein product [Leptidea sinapis]